MRSLRVATLNCWGKQGPWDRRRAALRSELAAANVDVVGLQEIVRVEIAGAIDDQSLALADMHGVFGAALDLGDGASFGNAILSRFPIRDATTTRLPNAHGAEQRVLLGATIDAPFGPVPFYTTHLTWRFEESALRMQQVRAIVDVIDADRARSGRDAYPAILVGDFNAEPDSDEIRFLRGLHAVDGTSTYFIDAFGEVGEGPGATFSARNDFARPCSEPERRIDYVFVRGRDPRGWGRPASCRVAFDRAITVDETSIFPTDHFGVVADLAVPERRA